MTATPESMNELKKQLEAVLFSAAKELTVDELARICKVRDREIVQSALQELQQELIQKNGPVQLMILGNKWKLNVHNAFLPIVSKVVTQTELPKGVIETLAVVAFKSPMLQSKLVRIRTNKAYDHLNQLENFGYITREKHGRTKTIKLTKKFFEYFDLPQERLQELFGNAEDIETALEEKEKEAIALNPELAKEAAEEATVEATIDVVKEKLGPFEVYDVNDKIIPKTQPIETEHISQDEKETSTAEWSHPESKGLYSEGMSEEVKAKIEEKVKRMLTKELQEEQK